MEDKITIIEGPSPTFELSPHGWASGVLEGTMPTQVAMTRLRTANGPALVERCYRTWRNNNPMYLEFRSHEGAEQEVPIVAARNLDMDDGQMLLLWVRVPEDEIEYDLSFNFKSAFRADDVELPDEELGKDLFDEFADILKEELDDLLEDVEEDEEEFPDEDDSGSDDGMISF